MTPPTITPERLAHLVNADEALVARGRLVDATIRLDIGAEPWLLRIEGGRVTSAVVADTEPVDVRLRLSASREEWESFWRPHPVPLHHDVMALLRRRALSVTGDVHLFMSHLRYVKDVLEKPRLVTTEDGAA